MLVGEEKVRIYILFNYNNLYYFKALETLASTTGVSSDGNDNNNGQLLSGFVPVANAPVVNAVPLANGGGRLTVLQQKQRAWAWARREFPNSNINYN